MYANMGRGWGSNANVGNLIIFIKYLVHKQLEIVARFFVSLIETPVLLRIPVLKNLF